MELFVIVRGHQNISSHLEEIVKSIDGFAVIEKKEKEQHVVLEVASEYSKNVLLGHLWCLEGVESITWVRDLVRRRE